MAREIYSGPGFSFSTEVDNRVAELHRLQDKLFDVIVGNTNPPESMVDKWNARILILESELNNEGVSF